MARINRKAAKKAAAAKGVKGKAFRTTFRAETKALNGGQSRFKRLAKGALKIAAGAIPGVGGAIAGALTGGEPSVNADTIPAFQKETLQVGTPSMAEAALKQADLVPPAPVVNINTPRETAPAFDKNAPVVEPSMLERTASNARNSDGVYDEEPEPRSGRSYAPSGPSTPKLKDNKMLYIIIGIVFFLVVVFFIAKTLGKK